MPRKGNHNLCLAVPDGEREDVLRCRKCRDDGDREQFARLQPEDVPGEQVGGQRLDHELERRDRGDLDRRFAGAR